jgi:hypothetical protein
MTSILLKIMASVLILSINGLHKESIKFLESELEKEFNGKTVVITHHVPTRQHYPEEYKGGILNQAFAADL